MEILGFLKAINRDVRARDHVRVLEAMLETLTRGGHIPESEKALCAVKEHESLEGALAGTGAAVFHCLAEGVNEPVIALGVSRKALPGPGKKHPARIFFLIISPMKESGTHLQMLSGIEAMLQDRGVRHAIMNAPDDAAVRSAIKKHESAGRALYVPLSAGEVFAELETSEAGLTEDEARRRSTIAGPNALKTIGKSPLVRDFFHNLFLNLFAVLLWAGGMMSFIAGMPELGWAIFLVIVINALFSFWQEYRASKAVEALKRLLPRKVIVIRDGQEKEIEANALVPGDLIKVSEGDSVPADGRLLTADEMRVDNSPLTGESKPVYKAAGALPDHKGFIWTELPNMVFAGTTVVSGEGKALVTATGMDTEIGRVAYLTQAIKPETSPLQKEINAITRVITVIAVSLGAAFFLLGYSLAGLTFAESFIFAIGIIVANVPEGLLPTVSLSLAMGVQRMASKNAIVKKLSAVETLGSSTVICTDKTGTLTENQMSVTGLFVDGRHIDVTGAGYAPEGRFISSGVELPGTGKDGGLSLLLLASALSNNAGLHPPGGGRNYWTITGDPTEGALLTAAAKGGIAVDELKGLFPRIAHLPFERIRKRMTTVHEVKGPLPGLAGGVLEGETIAFVKGSPKEILSLCASVYSKGKAVPFTESGREEILRQQDLMAAGGLRILAVAFRTVEKKERYKTEEVERELTFIGLAAMLDPPRPEVKKAVADCHSAGIKVVMVTGDYGLTARSIAEQVGLKAVRVISGEELNNISRRELEKILKDEGEVIFARVAPADKLRVVEALQNNGEVVAVTGDGVNDAPALRKADIGIAMGLRGSDVARESAEMVLADDNFASIVDAIREGRAVYANIKKFVTYIFASNIPEVIPFIAFILFRIPLPLTVLQILAVDLGTDVFPALGLGVEPPEKGIMDQPPRPRGKRLLDLKTLSRAYLFLGPVEAALSMSAFFAAYWMSGWRPGGPMPSGGAPYMTATTMTFAAIVACQIGNVFACKTDRASVFSVGFLNNRFVLFSLLAEISIMLALIYIPPLAGVFGFHPLSPAEWAPLVAFPFAMVVADEARKAVVRRGKP